MLVDSDILIWYLRGNSKAFEIINSNQDFKISVVTYIEIVQGLRNKRELDLFRKALRNWNATVLYINDEISVKSMFLIEKYYLSHSLQLADSLIASTAIYHGLELLTGNYKHYKIIEGLDLKIFKPS